SGASVRPISRKRDDQSVKTGRSMAQIAAQKDAEWQSNREEKKKPTLKSRIKAALKKKDPPPPRLRRAGDGEGAGKVSSGLRGRGQFDGQFGKLSLPKAKPRFIDPMKPRLLDEPPTAGDWSFELKFDGIRACAIKNGGKISLISRNGNELRARYP